MGCYPNVLPGYQHVTDADVSRKFSEQWGSTLCRNRIGLNSARMMEAAREGKIKALYIWGEDPAHTHGDTLNIRKALEISAIHGISGSFFTETARYAHVVLPAASFAEKEGTFTNTERRVQTLKKGDFTNRPFQT